MIHFSGVLLKGDILYGEIKFIDQLFEHVSSWLFMLVTSIMVLAILGPLPRLLVPMASIYSCFAVVQVVANVFSMILAAHVKTGTGLTELWDVAAVYAMSVIVFMMVYLLLDLTAAGGAFVWPCREGKPPPDSHLIDYLFIPLHADSTSCQFHVWANQ